MKTEETRAPAPEPAPDRPLNDTDRDPGEGGVSDSPGTPGSGGEESPHRDFQATGPFRHGEALLADAAGFAPTVLADARKAALTEGLQWALEKNRVAYTAAGVAAALEYLTREPVDEGLIAGIPLDAILQKTLLPEFAPAPEPNGEKVAKVTRFFLSRVLMEGVLATGETVRISVRSTENFKKGMEVPIRPKGGDSPLWILTKKAPRWPGRW